MQIVGNMGDSADRVIKNRPHRLNLVYTNQPLYFVTFATRDRKKLVSLERAQLALEAYGQGAANKFNVALGRYVIMPDHVHLFVRGDQNLILSSWIGGLSAPRLSRCNRRKFGNLDSLITFYGPMRVTRRNGAMFAIIPSVLGW